MLQRIYQRSPVFVQNLFCTGYGIRQRWRFYGPPFAACLASLNSNRTLAAEAIRAAQLSDLRRTFGLALRDVPYYQKPAYQDFLSEPLGWSTFQQLPLLSKDVLRNDPSSLHSSAFPDREASWGRTSGTTGTPLKIRGSNRGKKWLWAAMERMRQIHGVSRFQRRASLTGKVYVPQQRDARGVYWRHDRVGKRMLLSVYHLTDATAAAYVEALNQFRPTFIDGYPSALVRLARHLVEHPQKSIPSLKVAFPTAETLTPDARSTIEEGLRVTVCNQYGSTEMACHVGECTHGRLHASPEIGIVEILDANGQPAKPGDIGEVVLTSLVNDAMPLIRYRIGDSAVAADPDVACPCGLAFPIIGEILGRSDDLVITRSGESLPIMNYHVFKWAKGVAAAQLIQEDYHRFTLRVVPSNGEYVDLDRSIQELQARIAEPVEVAVEQVVKLPTNKGGKLRGVISHVGLGK